MIRAFLGLFPNYIRSTYGDLFEMCGGRLIERFSRIGCLYQSPRWAFKQDLIEAFTADWGLNQFVKFYWAGRISSAFCDVWRQNDRLHVRIGCQHFVGKDAERVREWLGLN